MGADPFGYFQDFQVNLFSIFIEVTGGSLAVARV
jgi:hypothetical protein